MAFEDYLYGCFLKWWYPTTIGFPTKNDHLGMFWGYHHLRKHPHIHIPYFSNVQYNSIYVFYFFEEFYVVPVSIVPQVAVHELFLYSCIG